VRNTCVELSNYAVNDETPDPYLVSWILGDFLGTHCTVLVRRGLTRDALYSFSTAWTYSGHTVQFKYGVDLLFKSAISRIGVCTYFDNDRILIST